SGEHVSKRIASGVSKLSCALWPLTAGMIIHERLHVKPGVAWPMLGEVTLHTVRRPLPGHASSLPNPPSLYACSMDILYVGTCRCTLADRRQPSARQHPRTRVCSCKRRGFYPYHLCKGRDDGVCHAWQNGAPRECGWTRLWWEQSFRARALEDRGRSHHTGASGVGYGTQSPGYCRCLRH